jgi:hypothetical protein
MLNLVSIVLASTSNGTGRMSTCDLELLAGHFAAVGAEVYQASASIGASLGCCGTESSAAP